MKTNISKLPEFDNHYRVYKLENKKAKLRGYIVIHKKFKKQPSFGATRLWNYSKDEEALRDALRLSKLMSYKSALASLPYGGAKATIIEPKGEYNREVLFKAYAEELNKIKGDFITGTDVGLSMNDLIYMKKYTKYIVGYTANPELATAQGIFKSLKVALDYVYKNHDYSKYSYAIQGVGKVGNNLLNILIKNGAKKIFIADIDKNKLKEIKKKFPIIRIVDTNKIHKQTVDIFSPCALSGILNKKSVKELNCKIIIGSANNQLSDPKIAELLHKKKILYCPDYIVNSGGLISVTDEYVNIHFKNNVLAKKITQISKTLEKIIKEGHKHNLPLGVVSDQIGYKIINKT